MERETRASCPPDSSSSPSTRLETISLSLFNRTRFYIRFLIIIIIIIIPYDKALSQFRQEGQGEGRGEGFASWIDLVSRLAASWIGEIGQCEQFLSRRSMNSYFTYVIYNGKRIFESFIAIFQFSSFFKRYDLVS